MADVNNSVEELITKEGYINGTNAKVAPFAYDSIGYANETKEGIEGVSQYSYENNQNIPIGDAKNLDTNSTTLSKGLRSQASSIPRQIMNHFFGRTSFNLNKIHEWFLRFLGYFQTHLRQDNNLWSPTTKYELGDVCFVLDTLTVGGADKHIARAFRCIKSASGGLVNVRPIDADTHEVNTEYWQENNVYDELYALHFHGQATDIADGAVTSDKIANGAVTVDKLADKAVTTAKIANGAITASKITDKAVITSGIADGAVTTAKIANKAVTTAEIGANAVTTAKLADGAVTATKCAGDVVKSVNGRTPTNGNVTIDLPYMPKFKVFGNPAGITRYIKIHNNISNNYTSNVVAYVNYKGSKIFNMNGEPPLSFDGDNYGIKGYAWTDPITGSSTNFQTLWLQVSDYREISVMIPAVSQSDNSITISDWTTTPPDGVIFVSNKQPPVGDGAITTDKIANGNVITTKIANSAITTDKIANSNVTTAKIANSAITTDKIGAGAVTTSEIADGAVTTAKIEVGGVTASRIADEAVSTDQIEVGAITTSRIADEAVTTTEIANGAVTADKCKSGSNLYMHYITLVTKTDDIFRFSFPSDEANMYIDIPPMFTKLLALFGLRSFPCNGLAKSLIGVAWGIALYGFMLPGGATLRVMTVKPDGSTQAVNIDQSSISNLIDRVIPIVAS